jgi:hypothetical protein
MSENHHVEPIINLLPEWPSGILHGIREVLKREPARKLRQVHGIIEANPPAADFPASRAGELLTNLGFKPRH